jgi:hypothetical protein
MRFSDVQVTRSRLLEGATYDVGAVPALPPLPVLHGHVANRTEWHTYIEHVYGVDGVEWPFDLNTLTWFYWFAPLHVDRLLLCDWVRRQRTRTLWELSQSNTCRPTCVTTPCDPTCTQADGRPEAPYGTPWTGGLAGWRWGPEHLVRRAGFFVHRRPWEQFRTVLAQAERVEVMRVGPIEHSGDLLAEEDRMWFYHAVGSGIFVRMAAFESREVRVRALMGNKCG